MSPGQHSGGQPYGDDPYGTDPTHGAAEPTPHDGPHLHGQQRSHGGNETPLQSAGEHRVGDIVNGHQWNGHQWIPVAAQSTGQQFSFDRGSSQQSTTPAFSHSGADSYAEEQHYEELPETPEYTRETVRDGGKGNNMLQFAGIGLLAATGIAAIVFGLVSLGGDDEPDSSTVGGSTTQPVETPAESNNDAAGGTADEEESAADPEDSDADSEGNATIGEAVRAGDLGLTVQSVVDEGATLGGEDSAEAATGRWVVVTIAVENGGDQPLSLFQDSIKLVDDKKRTITADPLAGIVADPEGLWQDELSPGVKVEQKLYYDVAKDAAVQQLVAKGGILSKGVTVDLTD